MHKLTIPYLIAASDMVDKILDLTPKLADHLKIPVKELYYRWASKRFVNGPVGIIENTNWKYWFSVKSCLLEHRKDKRFLTINFGPKGRIDTLGAIGNYDEYTIFNYIVTSKPPWPEYKELKVHFWGQYSQEKYEQSIKHIDNYSPIDMPSRIYVPSDAESKIRDLHHELISHRFVEPMDPILYKFNGVPNGRLELYDYWVRDCWIISTKGKDQIENHKK